MSITAGTPAVSSPTRKMSRSHLKPQMSPNRSWTASRAHHRFPQVRPRVRVADTSLLSGGAARAAAKRHQSIILAVRSLNRSVDGSRRHCRLTTSKTALARLEDAFRRCSITRKHIRRSRRKIQRSRSSLPLYQRRPRDSSPSHKSSKTSELRKLAHSFPAASCFVVTRRYPIPGLFSPKPSSVADIQ